MAQDANIMLVNCPDYLVSSVDMKNETESIGDGKIKSFGRQWDVMNGGLKTIHNIPEFMSEFMEFLQNGGHCVDKLEIFKIKFQEPHIEYHKSLNKSEDSITESITSLSDGCFIILTRIDKKEDDITIRLRKGRTMFLREELKRNFTVSIHAEDEVFVVRTLSFVCE